MSFLDQISKKPTHKNEYYKLFGLPFDRWFPSRIISYSKQKQKMIDFFSEENNVNGAFLILNDVNRYSDVYDTLISEVISEEDYSVYIHLSQIDGHMILIDTKSHFDIFWNDETYSKQGVKKQLLVTNNKEIFNKRIQERMNHILTIQDDNNLIYEQHVDDLKYVDPCQQCQDGQCDIIQYCRDISKHDKQDARFVIIHGIATLIIECINEHQAIEMQSNNKRRPTFLLSETQAIKLAKNISVENMRFAFQQTDINILKIVIPRTKLLSFKYDEMKYNLQMETKNFSNWNEHMDYDSLIDSMNDIEVSQEFEKIEQMPTGSQIKLVKRSSELNIRIQPEIKAKIIEMLSEHETNEQNQLKLLKEIEINDTQQKEKYSPMVVKVEVEHVSDNTKITDDSLEQETLVLKNTIFEIKEYLENNNVIIMEDFITLDDRTKRSLHNTLLRKRKAVKNYDDKPNILMKRVNFIADFERYNLDVDVNPIVVLQNNTVLRRYNKNRIYDNDCFFYVIDAYEASYLNNFMNNLLYINELKYFEYIKDDSVAWMNLATPKNKGKLNIDDEIRYKFDQEVQQRIEVEVNTAIATSKREDDVVNNNIINTISAERAIGAKEENLYVNPNQKRVSVSLESALGSDYDQYLDDQQHDDGRTEIGITEISEHKQINYDGSKRYEKFTDSHYKLHQDQNIIEEHNDTVIKTDMSQTTNINDEIITSSQIDEDIQPNEEYEEHENICDVVTTTPSSNDIALNDSSESSDSEVSWMRETSYDIVNSMNNRTSLDNPNEHRYNYLSPLTPALNSSSFNNDQECPTCAKAEEWLTIAQIAFRVEHEKRIEYCSLWKKSQQYLKECMTAFYNDSEEARNYTNHSREEMMSPRAQNQHEDLNLRQHLHSMHNNRIVVGICLVLVLLVIWLISPYIWSGIKTFLSAIGLIKPISLYGRLSSYFINLDLVRTSTAAYLWMACLFLARSTLLV